jgi:hypothetical protein
VILNGASFIHTVKRERLTVFKVSIYDMNDDLEAKNLNE